MHPFSGLLLAACICTLLLCRYEDNGDAVNNVVIISRKTEKGSVKDFGNVDEFLAANSYLFGEQTFKGNTISEGGFKKNKTSAASILDVQQGQDKKGKDYYKYELLVRSGADTSPNRLVMSVLILQRPCSAFSCDIYPTRKTPECEAVKTGMKFICHKEDMHAVSAAIPHLRQICAEPDAEMKTLHALCDMAHTEACC